MPSAGPRTTLVFVPRADAAPAPPSPIVAWDAARHTEAIERWLGLEPAQVDPRTFPPETYLVEGLACASLYLTRSSVAYVDNVVANPEAPPLVRARAIRRLLEHMHTVATAHGVRQIAAYSSVLGMRHTARAFGLDVTSGVSMRGRI